MNQQEAITTTKIQTGKTCRSDYRREIIAEIIDYGHAAFPSELAFKVQIGTWNVELSEIPTDQLLRCFIKVSRGRIVTFDVEPLTADEMLSAWRTN